MSQPSKVVPQEMTDAIARINAAVPAIAAKIQSLKDQISQSMTAEEVADVQSQLDGIATQLEGLATEPVQKKK
jgi:hypothetical protein